jgi:hypothetical protein
LPQLSRFFAAFKSKDAITKVSILSLMHSSPSFHPPSPSQFPAKISSLEFKFNFVSHAQPQALDNGIDYFHTGEDTRLGGLTRNM